MQKRHLGIILQYVKETIGCEGCVDNGRKVVQVCKIGFTRWLENDAGNDVRLVSYENYY